MERSDSIAEPAPAYEEGNTHQDDTKTDLVCLNSGTEVSLGVDGNSTFDEVHKAAADGMICAFGPRCLFYSIRETGLEWQYTVDKPILKGTVDLSTLRKWSIDWPFDVAFSTYGAAYFAFRNHVGVHNWHFVDAKTDDRPKKRSEKKKFDASVAACSRLKDWLDKNVLQISDVETTRVRFGPGSRFMAWKPDGQWISNDLPTSLETELAKRQRLHGPSFLPRQFAFGFANTWVAVWGDGTYSADLGNQYEKLSKILREHNNHKILNVALDYHVGGKHFIWLDPHETDYWMSTWSLKAVDELWDKLAHQWASTLNMTIRRGKERDGVVSKAFITADSAPPTATRFAEDADEPTSRTVKKAKSASKKSSCCVM